MMKRAVKQPPGMKSFVVGRADVKVLLDFLAKRLSLSRRAAKALADARAVWVNRKCVWMARCALRAGDVVEVAAGQAAAGARKPSAAAAGRIQAKTHVRVLWQNADYLVADKPAGLLSCDGAKSAESILREQENLPSLKAVHRLDRDTTGCLLFAKSQAALDAAIEMFKAHRVQKVYHAISLGAFRYAHQIIDAPLDGRPAMSRVSREASSPDASFLRIRIDTGRTNQIRRHLASVRAPVVGDRVFGIKSAADPRLMQVPRLMLHASTLALPDPMHPKDEIKAHSPLPADFRSALRLFGMGR